MYTSSWFFTLITIFNGLLLCRCYLAVTTYKPCDPTVTYPCVQRLNFVTKNSKQYLEGNITMAKPLDDTIHTNLSLELLVANRYVYLTSIYEKKSCESMHKYLGEFVYDLERAAGLIPGLCPVSKAKLQWHNYPMNYEKIATLASFPFGRIRATINLTEDSNSIYNCMVAEVELVSDNSRLF